MSFKVSNETKVGAFAAIVITVLILGYNFLAGKGSLFSKTTTLHSEFDNVSDLNTSIPILYNGFKIGNITDIELNKKTGLFWVYFKVSKDVSIPTDSKVKVESSILGEKSLNILNGNSTQFVKDGDEIFHLKDTTLFESMGNILKPLNSKINSIVASLDSLLASGELNKSISSLNASLKSFTKTSDNAAKLMDENMPKISATISHIESITSNLKNNNEKINLVLANLKTTTDNIAALNLKETVDKANKTIAEVSLIMDKINKGEGTLGLLVNDKQLYENLNKTAFDLDVLLKDLNKNPAKYVPIPFTKKQRAKAIENSNNTSN